MTKVEVAVARVECYASSGDGYIGVLGWKGLSVAVESGPREAEGEAFF